MSLRTNLRKIKEACCDFLRQSSMHGLKYIVQPNMNWTEKIFWSFIIIVGMGLSVLLSLSMFEKYATSSLMTSIESTHEPLSRFEFPSVTVCGQNRFSKSKLKRIHRENQQLQSLTENDLILIFKILIKPDSGHNRTKQLRLIQHVLDANRVTIDQLVDFNRQVMITCEDILLDCKWQDEEIPCSKLFTLRPTDLGYCCGFNYQRWYLNGTNIPQQTISPFTYNSAGSVNTAGYKSGLSIVLDTNSNDFITPISRSGGFKVLVHNLHEYPQVESMGFNISPGFETFVGTTPYSDKISGFVNSLSMDRRKCYRSSDMVLKFYGKYSFSNCLVECLTVHMLQKCTCRPFFLPASASDRICNLEEHVCLSGALHEFKDDPFPAKCHCLPRCDETWYTSELSLGNFPGEGFFDLPMANRIEKADKKYNSRNVTMSEEYFKKNVAALSVCYNKQVGYAYQTDILFTRRDLISAVGGVLGLGVGFSFISLIEILYFFGIRRFFSRRANSTIIHNSTRVKIIRKKKPANLFLQQKVSVIHSYPVQRIHMN